MLPLHYARRWRIASAVLLVGVLLATMIPVAFWSDRGKLLNWFVDVDKWLHGITFAFLTVWFAGLYRRSTYWRIAAGLVAFGVLIEGCQRLVTYRSADWMDIVADGAGIIAGLTIALLGVGGWGLHVERWWSEQKAGATLE